MLHMLQANSYLYHIMTAQTSTAFKLSREKILQMQQPQKLAVSPLELNYKRI